MVSRLILNKPQEMIEKVRRASIALLAAKGMSIEICILAIGCALVRIRCNLATALIVRDLDVFVKAIIFWKNS